MTCTRIDGPHRQAVGRVRDPLPHRGVGPPLDDKHVYRAGRWGHSHHPLGASGMHVLSQMPEFQGNRVFQGATVGTASGDSGGLRDGVGENDRFAVDDGLAVPVGDGRREAVALVADVLDHLALGGDAVADVDGAEVADLL